MERPGLDGRTETGSDVLGRGVGLLGAEAALLDRERRSIAGRIDVIHSTDPGVIVDRDEAALVGG